MASQDIEIAEGEDMMNTQEFSQFLKKDTNGGNKKGSLKNKDIFHLVKKMNMPLPQILDIVKQNIECTQSISKGILRYRIKKLESERACLLKTRTVANQLKLEQLMDASFHIGTSKKERQVQTKKIQSTVKGNIPVNGHLKEQIKSHEKYISLLKKQVASLNTRLKTKSLSFKARRLVSKKKIMKHKQTNVNLTENINNKSKCQSCSLKNEEVLHVKEVNAKLKEKVNENAGEVVQLYDTERNTYSDKARLTFLKLLNENVGVSHIGPVIEIVVTTLLGKKIDRLPSLGTIYNINSERLAMCQQQIKEVSTDTCRNLKTLYTDETSKYGDKFGAFIVTDENKNSILLGLREMESKSAATTLSVFQSILNDVDNCLGNQCDTSVAPSKKLLFDIRSTMSDRAATEKCFNKLLQEYRTTILPEVVPNWAILSEAERMPLANMHNFFCGLHLLVSTAEQVNKTLTEFEKANLPESCNDSKGTTRNESGTVRLVRTTCKAFSRGGDEKAGAYGPFSLFLHDRQIKNTLTNFRGNRFNIVFHNGASVFFLQNSIIEFLECVYGNDNLLLKSVLKDIKEPIYICGARSLGLIDKFITKPLWNLIESPGHILDMQETYEKLLLFLKQGNIPEFITGESLPFPVEFDAISRHLMFSKGESEDALCILMLESIFKDLEVLYTRILKDEIKGGENHGLDKSEVPDSSLKHNKLPEQVFGQLDFNMRHKPSATLLYHESQIMSRFNKNINWLNEKDEEKMSSLIEISKKQGKNIRSIFKIRKEEIIKKKKEMLEQKKKEIEDKKRKELAEKEITTKDIIHYGLWQSTAEIQNQLKLYKSETAKKEALKAQLRFRKNVLGQIHPDKSIFQFSSKASGQKTSEQLIESLNQLVKKAESINIEEEVVPIILGKSVNHVFKVKRKLVTFTGKVVSQVPGFPEWFNIVYDSEPDVVYTYKLMEDFENGDLTLKV